MILIHLSANVARERGVRLLICRIRIRAFGLPRILPYTSSVQNSMSAFPDHFSRRF